jgi:hypothetical protein
MTMNQFSSEDFAISEGGPLYNYLTKMRLFNTQGRLALLGLAITWFPLAIITAFEGTLYYGAKMPFLNDVAMQARILIALPMMIFIKVVIDNKVTAVIQYISIALLSPDERQLIIETTFARAKKLTSSTLTEIVLLLVVFSFTISMVKAGIYSGLEGDISSWMVSNSDGKQTFSIAGYWAVCVSIPTFQFLLIRWLWRYIVWTILLFRLSKSDLILLPTHPDRSGGLGIIMLAQRAFNLVFVASSVVISGQLMTDLLNHPESFNTIKNEAIGFIVICIILLIFFTIQLIRTKNEGLLHLSNLGAGMSQKFEKEWINKVPIAEKIEAMTVDPSMVYDYSGIFEAVQKMRPLPITPREIIGMSVMLLVPFIPILFIHFSVAELVQRIAGMLL